ncbi:iron reductase domain protein [Xylariaceae sp. FL0594]|nr:iron reductase domain protein [Xylariaceae sp. FL0594]
MHRLFTSAALSALTYFTLVVGDAVSHCPIDNVCYQVGVPEATASSGDGNIYLQLRAPTTYSWVALGTGSRMVGSNIFVMYSNGAGNVTVSARKATAYAEPQHQTDTKLELLAGSGITDNGNTMVANLKCSNCQSWDGGSLSVTSSSSPFVSAWKKGSAINSQSLTAHISQHDSMSQFGFNLARATLADDTNPFLVPSNGGGEGGSNTPNDGGEAQIPASIREIPTLRNAHGLLMSLVMVVLYPLGAIVMPLFGNWVLHAVWQMVAFLAMWAAFGIGMVLAQRTGIDFHSHHTVLGTVVVTLFGFQPIGGYIHHLHYLKHQSRGAVSYGHIWYGRILILLGIINGGLGLQLARAPNNLIVAYAVVAAIIFVAYVASSILGETKRKRGGGRTFKTGA